MVVRFVCVVCVPLCVRVSRVSRVCPGSPRCLFTGNVESAAASVVALTSDVLGCLRVSRNLEKNLPEAPQAPKFFEICHSPLHLPPKHTQYTCTG